MTVIHNTENYFISIIDLRFDNSTFYFVIAGQIRLIRTGFE